jgi:hypothetical protein
MQEIQLISEMLHFGLQNQAVISTLGIKYSILKVNLLSMKFVTFTRCLYRESHIGCQFSFAQKFLPVQSDEKGLHGLWMVEHQV